MDERRSRLFRYGLHLSRRLVQIYRPRTPASTMNAITGPTMAPTRGLPELRKVESVNSLGQSVDTYAEAELAESPGALSNCVIRTELRLNALPPFKFVRSSEWVEFSSRPSW